ncbi:MAG TPA: DUF6797 domain-containing protein [Tepidisphaeraceae bacterium]|nr:DUF6797 domain-containing protein [Tepidisphaeraceae bacterium]
MAVTPATGPVAAKVAPAPTTRPRDPWVFRSVLNKKPRMLTVALADPLWLAYDTQTCTLVKAWSGGVKFTGGVYDTRHGPQPQSQGETYFDQAAQGWSIVRDGRPQPIRPAYRGYTQRDGGVTLNYTVDLGDAGKVEVQEQPEIATSDGPATRLQRAFTIKGLPQGARLLLQLPQAGDVTIPEAAAGDSGNPAQAELETAGEQRMLAFDRDGTTTLVTELKAAK